MGTRKHSAGKSVARDASDSLSIDDLLSELARFEKRALPENTRRSYASDWKDFRSWCARRSRVALPASPETVALYLTARSRTHKVSSLSRRLTVIGKVHRAWGKVSPVTDDRVRRVWRGILHDKGEAPERKTPTLTSDIRKMVAGLEDDLAGLRDRALLLCGFAGAMRRSELVALNFSDLQLTDDGFVIHVRRSKTDQTGKGRKVGIPYGQHAITCPVRALLAWLERSHIDRGAIFRKVNRHGQLEGTRLSDRSVAEVVKRACRAAGLKASMFSGHSLRAGLATSAAMAGVEERSIQEQTGHKSLKVLRTYIREGNLFRNNAAKKVGL